jgi:ATP-dependent helicase HrpB
MAAMLEERDGSGLHGEVDLRLRLAAFREGSGSTAWRTAVDREARRITAGCGARPAPWTDAQEATCGDLLAHAFPDRVGRCETETDWRFPSGRVARLSPGSGLAPGGDGQTAVWCVAAVADAGESIGAIRLAAPVSDAAARAVLAPITTETTEIRWSGLRPAARVVHRAGRIVLTERPERPDPAAVAVAFADRVRAEGIEILPWDEGSRALLHRLRAYARRGGEVRLTGEDALGDDALAASAALWLGTRLDVGGGPVLTPTLLRSALAALPERRELLDHLAPETVTLPTGTRRRVDYSGAEPALEARIQELFGLASTPRIAGQPLTLRLLSPAGRPLQITKDLASFWKNTYPEVRKEMRGRYPRHPWPEDPTGAEPTSRAKRR